MISKINFNKKWLLITGVVTSLIFTIVFISEMTIETKENFDKQRVDLSQTLTNTQNWNEYKNTDMGFTIKYPEGVVINGQDGLSGVTFTLEKFKNNYQPLPVSLFIGRRGEISSDPIEELLDESLVHNGGRVKKDYRLVKLNNALGGQVIYKGNPKDDYYVSDSNNLGYPLRILIGNNDESIDISVFKQMVLTFEFIRQK